MVIILVISTISIEVCDAKLFVQSMFAESGRNVFWRYACGRDLKHVDMV